MDPQSSKTDAVKRNLKFSFHESTPVLKSSRKRKSFINSNQFFDTFDSAQASFLSCNSETSYETCVNDDSAYKSVSNKSSVYEYTFDVNRVMVSSPLDINGKTTLDKTTLGLSSSLEKCSLFDFENLTKRSKFDNERSPSSKRKSSSAPGTPNHSENESESSFKKYHSIDFTPQKSQYDNYKFGFNSPECKKILYPQLVERKPQIKPKSPQKLRTELKRLNKPAKKRLFLNHDFVYLFTRASNHRQIVNKIFSYLNDSDLMNVVKVSKLWKHAVCEDSAIYSRYKTFNTYMIRSKENLRSSNESMNLSLKTNQIYVEKENCFTPETSVYSPVKTKWQKYARLAEKLTPNQQLVKCLNCGDPSVLERNIAQCTKHDCQYIWCNRCSSGSKQGPDYFICKCEKGTTPPRSDKYSLGDISNIDSPSKSCSFLNDHYYNVSSINVSGNTSSGYFSQSEIDKSNLGSAKIVKSALGVVNRNISIEKRIIKPETRNLNTFHSVAEYCMRKKLHKKPSYEPSSPPKVKMGIIGSDKSKKSLRRLCR